MKEKERIRQVNKKRGQLKDVNERLESAFNYNHFLESEISRLLDYQQQGLDRAQLLLYKQGKLTTQLERLTK